MHLALVETLGSVPAFQVLARFVEMIRLVGLSSVTAPARSGKPPPRRG
jgi:hypothetical protein